MMPQDPGPIVRYSLITIEKPEFRESTYHHSHLAKYLDIYHPKNIIGDFEEIKMPTIDRSPG
jgi:hypothetical protein